MPNITKKSGLRYYTSLMKGYFEELFNIKVDAELNAGSKNPVQNRVVVAGLAQQKAELEVEMSKRPTTDEVQASVASGEWLPIKKGEGKDSIVEGNNRETNTDIEASHVEGYGNVIRGSSVAVGCHVEGRYAMPVGNAISLVGVGARTGAEKNARVIVYDYFNQSNGYMYVLGVGGYNGGEDVRSAKSLQEVVKDFETDIAGLKQEVDMSQYARTEDVKTSVASGEWLPIKKGEGENSIVSGNGCSATGQYAFARGMSTTASGIYSYAEGVFSIASGNYSHAEGSNAKPKGEYSHAEGERTEVASQGGHAEGVCTYLNDNEDVIHHVGVGYYNDKLSTDVILRKYGDAKNGYQYIIGIGGYNGKEITDATQSLQEVIKGHDTTITSTANRVKMLTTSISNISLRIATVEGSVLASRIELISSGGSTDEPIPFEVDGVRHDITQKKSIVAYDGFSKIGAPETMSDTELSRRSWINAVRLRNFAGNTMKKMFYGCGGVKKIDTTTWNTSAVTSMRQAFHGCAALEELDTSLWDTGSLTDLGYAFCGCTKLKQLDMRSWNTSAVTMMDGLFSGCSAMTDIGLAGLDVSHVQSMESTFANCGSLRRLDLRYWDLSAVTDMSSFVVGGGAIEELLVTEGFGKVLNAVGTIDLSSLTKWTGDSVQTLLTLYNRAADSSRNAITLRLSSQTKAALGTSGIQTLTRRGYTIA